MDGTVNWARREEGRVLRKGTCAVACGGAAGAAGTTGADTLAGALAGTFTAPVVVAAEGVLATALVLLVSAFNSCLLAVRADRLSHAGCDGGSVNGLPL
jgi:hypothetical protein